MDSIKSKPLTRRCVYCRPFWTYGTKPWTLLGRLYAFIWPPHIIGEDFGPPYTDGICEDAAKKMEARDAKRKKA